MLTYRRGPEVDGGQEAAAGMAQPVEDGASTLDQAVTIAPVADRALEIAQGWPAG